MNSNDGGGMDCMRPHAARRPEALVHAALLLCLAVVGGCGGDDDTVVLPAAPEPSAFQAQAAEALGLPASFENRLGMRFALLPAGTFTMGAPKDESKRFADETQHEVTLTAPFYLMTTEVANAWFRAFRPGHHSSLSGHLDGGAQAVVRVTWEDASAFAAWLSEQDGERTYRLPTEAEWEYACRAGTTTPYSFGDTISTDLANYDGTTTYGGGTPGPRLLRTVNVASLPPNPWGLYEMHGNAWEWCQDRYGRYAEGPAVDPMGQEDGEKRVYRGGAYEDAACDLRSAWRGNFDPTQLSALGGFRLVSPVTR